MMRRVPLVTIAHARSGDKGNSCNIGLIPRKPEHYPILEEQVTAERVERDYAFEGVHEAIRRFCLARGIAHRDLLPALRGRPSESLSVHPVDRHPNELAQRLAAEALAPEVARLLVR